jgi:hypothetical protein
LHFKRTFVDATVHDTIKTRATLVEERRRSKVRIACVNRRTAGQQRVGKGGTAIILQRTKHWIGIDLIARASQGTGGIVTA